jgi:hypothetical protein
MRVRRSPWSAGTPSPHGPAAGEQASRGKSVAASRWLRAHVYAQGRTAACPSRVGELGTRDKGACCSFLAAALAPNRLFFSFCLPDRELLPFAPHPNAGRGVERQGG